MQIQSAACEGCYQRKDRELQLRIACKQVRRAYPLGQNGGRAETTLEASQAVGARHG